MNNNIPPKLNQLAELSKRLTFTEFKYLMKLLDPKKVSPTNINKLLGEYDSHIQQIEEIKKIATDSKSKWVYSAYEKELAKIKLILNDPTVQKEIEHRNIMLSGKTGTGKTTLAKAIAKSNPNFEFETVNLESSISSKLGQSQINLICLASRWNASEKPKIIFLDELDSVILSRVDGKSDVAEHSRIVATFIKLLDSLNPNIVIITATNVVKTIDKAVLRRFSIQVKAKTIDMSSFFKMLTQDGVIKINKEEWNLVKNSITHRSFTIAELRTYTEYSLIEKKLDPNKKDVDILLEYFKEEKENNEKN